MTKYYYIAGLTVEMDSFGRTAKQAEPYLCSKTQPDITIESNWQALQEKQPQLHAEECEYLCTGASFYRQLLEHRGMMLHASAVVLDGKAYLFSAPCGTGKSTHTDLWRQVFGPDRAQILNDDKPALRFEYGRWYAYGTPWSGKTDQNLNIRAEIAGICFLHQADKNSILPFTGPKVIHSLLEQTVRPAEAALRMELMTLLDLLISMVPLWQMGCNMDPEAAIVSYETMSGIKQGELI